MLSKKEIIEKIEKNELYFSGRLRGSTLLLSLGSTILPFSKKKTIIEPWNKEKVIAAYADPILNWDIFDLEPQTTVLCSVLEELSIRSNIAGEIGTLSHIARLGLFAHLGSPFVDAGFDGYLTLELFNASPHIFRLRFGMPIAKLVLFSLSSSIRGLKANKYGSSENIGSLYYEEFAGLKNYKESRLWKKK